MKSVLCLQTQKKGGSPVILHRLLSAHDNGTKIRFAFAGCRHFERGANDRHNGNFDGREYDMTLFQSVKYMALHDGTVLTKGKLAKNFNCQIGMIYIC